MKKKKSPVKVVVPLILAVAAAGVGYKVVNRYIPSKEVMAGNEYVGTSGGEDAAVVLPDRLEQGKALVKDGTAYVCLLYTSKTGVRTFEAAAFLRRCGADVTRVRKMFRNDMS